MDPTQIVDCWHKKVSLIDDNHWQGGFPEPFRQVAEADIDVIVMTASDVQPNKNERFKLRALYPNLSGILAPFDDTSAEQAMPRIARIAHKAADKTVAHLEKGKRVLVTCAAGRNRSGLVSALVLMRRRDLTGVEALRQVQAMRDSDLPPGAGAITNPMFAAYLERLPKGFKL